MSDPSRGLYCKYRVERTDGTSNPGGKHHGCEYFVLDVSCDPHAVSALNGYIQSCEASYPLLARDLKQMLIRTRIKQEEPTDETMSTRTEYELTEEELRELLEACKPTPCMLIGGYATPTPQENANRAWEALGRKRGFDVETVQPVSGKGDRFFSAMPQEPAHE